MDACEKTIYIGESFAFVIPPAAGRDITDYDITAHILTQRNGERIIASTSPAGRDIPIQFRSDNVAFFNVPPQQSMRLRPGIVKVWSELVHRPTGDMIVREESLWWAGRSLLSNMP